MSGPDTRPLGDNFPNVKIDTQQGGSTSSKVEQNINGPLPFIWINGVMAALALAFAISGIILALIFWHRAEVAENHWRNDEVEIMNMKDRIKHLEDDSHARNR